MRNNRTIKILEAVTNVNSVSKKSRIEGDTLFIGKEVFKREDGIFFKDVIIDGKTFRPFFNFTTKYIYLDCVGNSKVKTITIKKYE